MRFGPLTGLGDTSNEVCDHVMAVPNQPLGYNKAAGNKVRPDVFGIIEHPPGTIDLGLCGMGLADKISVYSSGGQGGRHIRRRQFYKPDLVRADLLFLHELANYKVLI